MSFFGGFSLSPMATTALYADNVVKKNTNKKVNADSEQDDKKGEEISEKDSGITSIDNKTERISTPKKPPIIEYFTPSHIHLYIEKIICNTSATNFKESNNLIYITCTFGNKFLGKSNKITLKPSSGGYRSVAFSNFYVKLKFEDYLLCLQKNNNVGIYFEIRLTNVDDLIGVMQINGHSENDAMLPYLNHKFDNKGKRIKKLWLSSQLHGHHNSYIMSLLSSSLSYDKEENVKNEECDTTRVNNYVNDDILPQCPNYDRYGISVKSSAELQIQSYEWRSYYNQENEFQNFQIWSNIKHMKVIRQEHPFSLIGMGEDKKPTKIKEITESVKSKIKSTLTSNYLESHTRKDRLKWRKEIWKGSIPRKKRMEAYLELSGGKIKRAREGKSYFTRLCNAKVNETDAMQIEVDLPRTFAGNNFSKTDEYGNIVDSSCRINDLRLVLGAFSCRNRAIGYCQAMNYIVARLLMIGGAEDAFWVLCAICEDIFPGYWVPSMTGVQADIKVLEDLIHARLPRVAAKIKRLEIPITGILSQYILTLFLLSPSDCAFRIFDVILLEGGNALLAVAFGYFKLFEHEFVEQARDFNQFCNILKRKVEIYHNISEILDIGFNELNQVGRKTIMIARNNFRRDFNKNAVFERRLKNRLKRSVKMKNDGEFNVAYTIFKQMALSNVDKDLELKKRELSVDYWKLDLEDFRTVFIQLNSSWSEELSLIDRLFVTLDRTHSGYVDINEFMHGIQVLSNGTNEEKMTLIFLAYDTNDSNSINREELKSLLRTVYLVNGINLEQNTLIASLEACMSMITPEEAVDKRDVKRSLCLEENEEDFRINGNAISLESFIQLHKFQPLILKCFSLSLFESE